jgi:hypothetical protein
MKNCSDLKLNRSSFVYAKETLLNPYMKLERHLMSWTICYDTWKKKSKECHGNFSNNKYLVTPTSRKIGVIAANYIKQRLLTVKELEILDLNSDKGSNDWIDSRLLSSGMFLDAFFE